MVNKCAIISIHVLELGNLKIQALDNIWIFISQETTLIGEYVIISSEIISSNHGWKPSSQAMQVSIMSKHVS